VVDVVDVEPLELHHRVHVALERVQLPQPGDLGAPLGLLGDLRELALVLTGTSGRRGGCLGASSGIQAVERPLRYGPAREGRLAIELNKSLAMNLCSNRSIFYRWLSATEQIISTIYAKA
jgi:hypothetical protein